MLTFKKFPNIDAVVIKLIRQLSISLDSETISAELEKHPDYPSLLAVSDILNTFNVENSAFRVQPDKFLDIPCPFIAHVNSTHGGFVLVSETDRENVKISNEHWDNHKMDIEEFKNKLSGIVLIAQPPEKSFVKKSPFTAMSILNVPVAIGVLILILISTVSYNLGHISNISWNLLLFTLFKSAGLVISILLLIQSIDGNNPLVQALCNSSSGKNNCNAILSSKTAVVFEGLSWSELGFYYFAGTWLLLIFGSHSIAMMQVLVILNIACLPYTFYSIYYQVKVAKQWCVLCCTIQGLLWLEFVSSVFILQPPHHSLRFVEWDILLTLLGLPIASWILLKPLFLKLQQFQPLKEQLRTLKYNTVLFNTLLKDQPRYVQPGEDWSIVLGNVQAGNSITMVTNPYCGPCAKTHKLLEELLQQREDVQARIVFTANNNESDRKTPIARHMMALSTLEDKTVIRRAMHDWYAQELKDYNSWAKVYPVQMDETEFYKIDKQKAWCDLAEVTVTPTLLLNGSRIPPFYQLNDLKYMLQ